MALSPPPGLNRVKTCYCGNKRFVTFPPSWIYKNINITKIEGIFLNFVENHVFTAQNRNIIKNIVKKKKSERVCQKINIFI